MLFLITFLTSIPAALLLYSPVLDHTNYILGAGADTMAILGLIGGPLIIVSGTAVLFNVIEPGSAPQFIGTRHNDNLHI